jgi:hypothetical protein
MRLPFGDISHLHCTLISYFALNDGFLHGYNYLLVYCFFNFKPCSCITSLAAKDRMMYSTSAVNNTISTFNFGDNITRTLSHCAWIIYSFILFPISYIKSICIAFKAVGCNYLQVYCFFNFKPCSCITSLAAKDRMMYSTSAVNNTISTFNFGDNITRT